MNRRAFVAACAGAASVACAQVNPLMVPNCGPISGPCCYGGIGSAASHSAEAAFRLAVAIGTITRKSQSTLAAIEFQTRLSHQQLD